MKYPDRFDVIVVGGGHAGVEAGLASARIGVRTLMITHNIDTVGQMSCNPSIGGIGKGHIVKEIDVLGGIMAKAIDKSGIHFRILNSRKGPAVQATRAQADRALYRKVIRQAVDHQKNLTIFQQPVEDLIIKGNRVTGVRTQLGIEFFASAVVLTTGTFLNGIIYVGVCNQRGGGRAGDPPSLALADRLKELSLNVGRLKTGTPPKIDGKTIDYTKLVAQSGDSPTPVFSFLGNISEHPKQVNCHITETNKRTHQIIEDALYQSPIYGGVIDSIGPRYCPSIEDKVVRFSDRHSHKIFIEPEGLNVTEVYPNGISTSLPFNIQHQLVRSIIGLEQAVITRPGYAIEYDFFDPRGLRNTLETKSIHGLFFAGQINGTTGYEEAAGQGVIAGLNAARLVQQKDLWCPERNEAYIGVMIDDLVTQGTTEPYRMFTSRAEYRLQLREDNADFRLTDIAYEFGLIDEYRKIVFMKKMESIELEKQRLKTTWVFPNKLDSELVLKTIGQPLLKESNLFDLMCRPGVHYQDVMMLAGISPHLNDTQSIRQIEIQSRYMGYIERQILEINRQKTRLNQSLPETIDYRLIKGLSVEVQQKFREIRPQTVAQASRIPGVTPAAISVLLVYLKKIQHVT